jgi:hypothetical protein
MDYGTSLRACKVCIRQKECPFYGMGNTPYDVCDKMAKKAERKKRAMKSRR